MFWRSKDYLDYKLLAWSKRDVYTVRSLMQSLLILGITGSGKTSSSGRTIGQKVVNHPRSCGLILAAQPGDLAMWRDIFKKAGRLKDLIVFDADGPHACNLMDCLSGGGPRLVTDMLINVGQTLRRGKNGGENAQFWEAFTERCIYETVVPLQLAGEPLTAERMLRFLMTAPHSMAEMADPNWQRGYHPQVMMRAESAPKTSRQQHDFNLVKEFWGREYPRMDDRTRANGIAGVTNILTPFNQGLCREKIGGDTTFTPQRDILNGKWVFCDFSPNQHGTAGAFISSALKYVTQQAILKRKADCHSPFCVLWADEAHLFMNEMDARYLAMCRSHRGNLVYLTQSVASVYAAFPGEAGRFQADSLMSNFGMVIAHAVDPLSAKFLAGKLGRRKQILASGGFGPVKDLYDELFSQPQYHGNFSEHYEEVMQVQQFQHGLRMGGPGSGYVTDSWVIRSGEPFASGDNHKFVTWSQRN